MNLGARYSFFNIFHEVLGRANPFDFATCGPQGFCGVGASFGQPNYGDFDPRVALAWAPRRNGHTVIRAGFGTYHEDGQLDDQNLPIANGVSSYSLSNKTTSNLSYPIDPFLVGRPGSFHPGRKTVAARTRSSRNGACQCNKLCRWILWGRSLM